MPRHFADPLQLSLTHKSLITGPSKIPKTVTHISTFRYCAQLNMTSADVAKLFVFFLITLTFSTDAIYKCDVVTRN